VAVVFLRLVLPVFPEAPVSLVPEALSVASSSQIFRTGLGEAGRSIDSGHCTRGENQNTTAGNLASADIGPDLTSRIQPPRMRLSHPKLPEQTVSKHALPPVSTGSILFILWAAGLISLCVYNMVSYSLLHRRIRGAAFCANIMFRTGSARRS
jgi:hypothetical protein